MSDDAASGSFPRRVVVQRTGRSDQPISDGPENFHAITEAKVPNSTVRRSSAERETFPRVFALTPVAEPACESS